MPEGRIAPYDLSLSVPPFEKCPGCGLAWTPTLWLIVDADHRPDLVSEIQNGTFCVFRCTACANPVYVNAPLLVVRARTPRLLYSPSPGTTSLEDHNQLVHALSTLKEVAADHWRDDVIEDLAVVPRRLVSAELTADIWPPTHPPTELVDAFLEADTAWKQQYVLARYPELYQDDPRVLFEQLFNRVRQEENDTKLLDLEVRRGMLVSCHVAGVTAVKSLLPALHVYMPMTGVGQLLLAVALAIQSRQQDEAVVGLFEATQVVPHGENPLLWAELHRTLGELAGISAASADPDVGIVAQEAYEAVATAAFSCGPWLALMADCRARLAALCLEHHRSSAEEERAIRFYEAAIEGFELLGAKLNVMAMYDALGYLHYRRTEQERTKHLEEALRCFRAGTMQVDRGDNPRSWAAMQFNVGNTLLELAVEGQLENVDQAVFHLAQAAEVNEKLADQERLRDTIARLQTAYELRSWARHTHDPRSADLGRALSALGNRGWEHALKAYKSVIAKTEDMLASVYTEEKRWEVFSDVGTAYSACAYICFRLERFDEGIALLEAGRCRILTEEVQAFDILDQELPASLREEVKEAREELRAVRTAKLASRPGDEAPEWWQKVNRGAWLKWVAVHDKVKNVAPEATNPEIGERELLELAPQGGALVLPVFSIVGCCVLVVPHGRRSLSSTDLLWIDDFTDNDLMDIVEIWCKTQTAPDRAKRCQAVAAMCKELWDFFACRVGERLKELELAAGAPVVILPSGGLGCFPLQAAAPEPELSGGFLDAYSVSYAPSAYLLSLMRRRAADRLQAPDVLLGLIDPLGDLHYGRLEGTMISSLFPEQQRILRGKGATGNQLADAVVNKKYVHLSCHAYYTTDGGNYSGLYLAHDPFTKSAERMMAHAEGRPPLKEFFLAGRRWIALNLDLTKCLLVTLSACESGRADVGQPDEFLGLPAAFIRAGAASVVSTLWRVDDVAGMLLTRKLYEGLVHDHLNPAVALRQAQRWLRDATNESLYRFYNGFRT